MLYSTSKRMGNDIPYMFHMQKRVPVEIVSKILGIFSEDAKWRPRVVISIEGFWLSHLQTLL